MMINTHTHGPDHLLDSERAESPAPTQEFTPKKKRTQSMWAVPLLRNSDFKLLVCVRVCVDPADGWLSKD